MRRLARGEWRVARGPVDGWARARGFAFPRHSRGTRLDGSATRHSAYTLLELLLVLAIIVAVAGVVTPTVVDRMGDYKLKRGAEMARSAISSTRIHAIDLSSVYQFRVESGGRRYLAIPTDTEALVTSQTASSTAANALPTTAIVHGELPEDLSFQPVVLATGNAPSATMATTGMPPGGTDPAWTAAFGHVPNSGDYLSAAWSAPVIFRPDGSAMEAAVNVIDKRGDGFQLKVRELTGEVTVTRLTTGTR
jgi:type II secretory pathway pseudopilin PulG